MKLYEYSILLRCATVVAADSEEAATAAVKTMSADGIKLHTEFMGVADIDLLDTRDMKAKNPHDEAHIVVHAQEAMQ